jgi:hypothetical protein
LRLLSSGFLSNACRNLLVYVKGFLKPYMRAALPLFRRAPSFLAVKELLAGHDSEKSTSKEFHRYLYAHFTTAHLLPNPLVLLLHQELNPFDPNPYRL